MDKIKKAFSLFGYFFRIGWFTFGGGWSIVAQIEKDFVEDKEELKGQELLDIVSVGRSLPGTMIGNVAYLFGYHQCGALGGVSAVLGIIVPPLIMLSFITIFYDMVRDNIWISRALIGVRACVAPVILSAVLKLHKGAFPEKYCYVLFATGFVLSFFFNVSCIVLVLIGLAAGFFMNRKKEGGDERC